MCGTFKVCLSSRSRSLMILPLSFVSGQLKNLPAPHPDLERVKEPERAFRDVFHFLVYSPHSPPLSQALAPLLQTLGHKGALARCESSRHLV